MMTEEWKNVGIKSKRVPDWLNSPTLWSAKPISIIDDDEEQEMEENVCAIVEDESPTCTSASANNPDDGGIQSENEKIGEVTTQGEASNKKSKSHKHVGQSSNSDLPYVYHRSYLRDLLSDTKVERFTEELSKKVIDLTELQLLANQGIPDYRGLRAIVWKLLLCYLPKNRDAWERELAKKRSKYAVLKQELLVNPSELTRKLETSRQIKQLDSNDEKGLLRRHEISHGDHPLSLVETSVWNQFFQDTEIADQIERDIKRTHPDMPFFSGNSVSSLENQDAMKRILLIFAKMNRSIQYVQGMNEVLAPLYYVFKTDPDEGNAVHAEADAFSCFVELLSNFLDHFSQKLDNTAVGIRSTMVRMTELLKIHDEELWRHLDATTKVNPQFYAFRWITLLFTQEFRLPDCLRIWDSLLSNPYGPMDILLRICCAMLI
ncbi:hypothetical protein SUGI_0647230 [Cryptomeria japonica]|nr:hypothetical protein SUGI_0647230 [Cryptomeria japonica]